MYISEEQHFRNQIRPEHWEEFVSKLPKLVAPFTAHEQAVANMTAHFVAEQIMGEHPDDYPLPTNDEKSISDSEW